jgi:hypothetical protein
MKSSRRTWWVWGLVILGVALVVRVFLFARTALKIPGEAYAMWTAGQLVCQHLEMNGQRWPTNWHELDNTYRFLQVEFSSIEANTNVIENFKVVGMDDFLPATFEVATKLVVIDWDADVGALKNVRRVGDERPFRVFKLINGRGTSWEGREPNRMLWNYLQSVTNRSVGKNTGVSPAGKNR